MFKFVVREMSAKESSIDCIISSMEVLEWNHRGWFNLVKTGRKKLFANNGNNKIQSWRQCRRCGQREANAEFPGGDKGNLFWQINSIFNKIMQAECLKLKAVNEPKEIARTKKNNFRSKVFPSISVRPAHNYGSIFIYWSNKNQEGEGKKRTIESYTVMDRMDLCCLLLFLLQRSTPTPLASLNLQTVCSSDSWTLCKYLIQ